MAESGCRTAFALFTLVFVGFPLSSARIGEPFVVAALELAWSLALLTQDP